MSQRVEELAEATAVVLSGDIDLDTSPAARKVLLAAVRRSLPVYVDLSGVTYIDSSGVASLIEAFQQARELGVPFLLTEPAEAVVRVLSLARLDRVLPIGARPGRGAAGDVGA